MATEGNLPIGARIQLPGHFDGPVVLEDARPLHNGFECRARLANGTLEEAVISQEEAARLTPDIGADSEKLRLLIESARIGPPDDDGKPAPLVDVLHRTLWLMENQPCHLTTFLDEACPDRERLRLVAQALAGAGLSGGSEEQVTLVNTTASEQAALGKLLANWCALVPETLFTK